MKMNRAAFYSTLRKRASGVFGTVLSQGAVDGMESILDQAERRETPLRWLAYMLSTAYHETAHTMQPIAEYGGRRYFDKYEPGTRIGKNLGNTLTGDGYRFRGRGFVQLTGRRNYHVASTKLGVDFVADPEAVRVEKHAAAIMFAGMEQGWFTGKKLADYITPKKTDYVNSRRIINGTDRAALIARYASAFEAALRSAGYPVSTTT